jgi:predicted nucleic acid-binding protein
LPEARRHAELWAELASRGAPIGAHDMLVAATALANAFELATLNRGEFERVPGLSLVRLDDFIVSATDAG